MLRIHAPPLRASLLNPRALIACCFAPNCIAVLICIQAHLAVKNRVELRLSLNLRLCLACSNANMGYDSPASTIAVCVLLPVIALITIALRFFARRVQRAPVKLDDLLVLPALVSAIQPFSLITHDIMHPSWTVEKKILIDCRRS